MKRFNWLLVAVILLFASLSNCEHDALAVQPMVAAGDWNTVGLKSDGTVVATGSNYAGQCNVTLWTGIVQVAASNGHTVGLKSDGTVVATGVSGDGRCDVTGWTGIVQVAAGNFGTVGLKSDGTVVTAGDILSRHCDVSGWTNIVQVAAGDHIVGLKSDGTVVAIGDFTRSGECDVTGWTGIVQVAAGRGHTVGLKSDGTVVAIGRNDVGQSDVSGWTGIVQVDAGSFHTVGLKSDGTVVAIGENYHGECDVSGWTGIVQVAAGDDHTVGLRSIGTVVATVSNQIGWQHADVKGWILNANIGELTGMWFGSLTLEFMGQKVSESFVQIIYQAGDVVFMDSGLDPEIILEKTSENTYQLLEPLDTTFRDLNARFDFFSITEPKGDPQELSFSGRGVITEFSEPFSLSAEAKQVSTQSITNGSSIPLFGERYSLTAFVIDVPVGSNQIEITTQGGYGDCDLFVAFSRPPFFWNESYNEGSDENITLLSPAPGSWYVWVVGYSSYSDVTLTVNVTVPPPVPGILGNWQDQVVYLSKGDPLDLILTLDPKAEIGKPADWWLGAYTPNGWMYFDLGSLSWLPGLSVTFQGPLFPFPQKPICQVSDLPIGTSNFYFGVDTKPNGIVDVPIYFASITVNALAD